MTGSPEDTITTARAELIAEAIRGLTDNQPPGWVLCPHCGLYVDPAWGRCAHDPDVDSWEVKARLR